MEYSPKIAALLLLALASAMVVVTAQNSPQDFVDPHNAARADVGVGPVTWDDNVAAYAQNYAEQRRGDCQLVHSGGQYGENIYGGRGGGADWTAADAVQAWVSEKQYYDHGSNSCSAPADKSCLHYTQERGSRGTLHPLESSHLGVELVVPHMTLAWRETDRLGDRCGRRVRSSCDAAVWW
uniref:Pathogenesis-related protein PRMS n=1 Tax=Aegilops tauschii TaxID=37682 RepID=M8CDY7_AEGTA